MNRAEYWLRSIKRQLETSGSYRRTQRRPAGEREDAGARPAHCGRRLLNAAPWALLLLVSCCLDTGNEAHILPWEQSLVDTSEKLWRPAMAAFTDGDLQSPLFTWPPPSARQLAAETAHVLVGL